MVTFNVDNLTLFYLGMSILALAGVIIVIFGRTEERSHRKR